MSSETRDEAIDHLRRTLAPTGRAAGSNQRFAVVPLSRRNAFLVPLTSRAAARRSLSEYAAMRPLAKRVVREALGAAWATGIPELLFRQRAELPDNDETLLGHLRDVLSERALTFAAGLRRVGSFYTPVLQLFRPDGTPVAYAKIGWDAVTRTQVRAESDALGRVAAASPRRFHAPALLHAGPWEQLELCVTGPLPRRARRVPKSLLPPVLALYEVAQLDGALTQTTLRESAWWARTRAEASELDSQAPGLLDALARLEGDLGDVVLEFGRWHGDWVSWNMALGPDGIYVWDWEYSRPDVPFGLDLLHFYFQNHFVLDERPQIESFERAAAEATDGLRRLGVDDDAKCALHRLHRLELRLRAERAVRDGAEPEQRVRETAISTLL